MRAMVTVVAAIACLLVAAAQPRAGPSGRGLAGGVTAYTAVKGDTLSAVSARFGVDVSTLGADNALTRDATLTVGQILRIDNRHIVPDAVSPGVIIVNVPQRMMFYDSHDGLAAFPVAVGQATWRTPTLPFTVLTRETDPSWEVPVSIQEEARRAGRPLPAVVPPGPKNPLGKFWLGLSIPSVGIHGTNAPSSIYRAGTHGCIRLGPDDIAWLFPRVALGTRGEIIYAPILLAAVGAEVFLEVHADVYRRLDGDPITVVRRVAEEAGLTADIDWARAEAVIAARHGVARHVGPRENPRPDPIFTQ